MAPLSGNSGPVLAAVLVRGAAELVGGGELELHHLLSLPSPLGRGIVVIVGTK